MRFIDCLKQMMSKLDKCLTQNAGQITAKSSVTQRMSSEISTWIYCTSKLYYWLWATESENADTVAHDYSASAGAIYGRH